MTTATFSGRSGNGPGCIFRVEYCFMSLRYTAFRLYGTFRILGRQVESTVRASGTSGTCSLTRRLPKRTWRRLRYHEKVIAILTGIAVIVGGLGPRTSSFWYLCSIHHRRLSQESATTCKELLETAATREHDELRRAFFRDEPTRLERASNAVDEDDPGARGNWSTSHRPCSTSMALGQKSWVSR